MTSNTSVSYTARELSITDIVAVLHYYILRIDTENFEWQGKDCFTLYMG